MMASRACALVAVAALAAVLCAPAAHAADLFTSSASVHNLFGVEKELSDALQSYIQQQESRLQRLKEIAAEFKSQQVPESDVKMKAADGFGVIRRLVDGLTEVKQAVEPPESLRIKEFLAYAPDSKDVRGAAASLLRLQRTYELSARDLLPNGTCADFLWVGKEAYEQEDFGLAYVWLIEALHVSHGQASFDDHKDILDYLAYVSYKLDDIAGAKEYSERLLKLDPSNERVEENVIFYDKTLKRGQVTVRKNVTTDNIPQIPKNYNVDNILQHDSREMDNFRRLCRGEILYKPEKPLFCKYYHFGKPHLLLKPIAIEHVRHGRQQMRVYRNFASHSECRHMIQVGRNRLKRAVAWTDGEFQPVEFRISTAAWIDPSFDEVFFRVNNRIADATLLNLDYAEQLQVSNYGMGGHYEPHYDYHGSAKELPEGGDRLATFMIYLSPVEAGGRTAFPRLDAAISPNEGDAAFWYNMDANNVADPFTLHGGCPVLSGSKWVANKWIHEKGNEVCRKIPQLY